MNLENNLKKHKSIISKKFKKRKRKNNKNFTSQKRQQTLLIEN
jgi:hypothetical protein